MSLNHNFFLIKIQDHKNWSRLKNSAELKDWSEINGWSEIMETIEHVDLHDDVLRYIQDTLQWIPTYNPSTQQARQGLCWYGETWIQVEGAVLMAKIFMYWADLLNCGSLELELTGSYSYQIENDPAHDGFEIIAVNSGRYEKLIFNRDELVKRFRALAEYAEQVQEQSGSYYILHCGI